MTKKKSKRFQFELGIPGLIFVTGLLICLFLWMFVLGFWLGQKMVASKAKEAASPVAQKALKEAHQSPSLVAEEIKTPKVIPEKPAKKELFNTSVTETRPVPPKSLSPEVAKKEPKKEKSQPPANTVPKVKKKTFPTKFYTIQVASFRSPKEAQKYARLLGSRGYEALVKKVNLPQKGIWYRVYVGRFNSFKEAKKFGAVLQKKEKIKTYYITRLEEKH
jgi:cell division septation protein DedD